MAKLNKQQVQQIARKHIGASLSQFMPNIPGQTYVNGSYPRNPYYGYERAGVANEAYRKTVAELRRIENTSG